MKRLLFTKSKKKNVRRDSKRSLKGRSPNSTIIRREDVIETTLAIRVILTTKQSSERPVLALAEQNQCSLQQNQK